MKKIFFIFCGEMKILNSRLYYILRVEVSLFVLSPEIEGRDEVEVVNWEKNTRNDVNVLDDE
jgi:hypothetical protein